MLHQLVSFNYKFLYLLGYNAGVKVISRQKNYYFRLSFATSGTIVKESGVKLFLNGKVHVGPLYIARQNDD